MASGNHHSGNRGVIQNTFLICSTIAEPKLRGSMPSVWTSGTANANQIQSVHLLKGGQ